MEAMKRCFVPAIVLAGMLGIWGCVVWYGVHVTDGAPEPGTGTWIGLMVTLLVVGVGVTAALARLVAEVGIVRGWARMTDRDRELFAVAEAGRAIVVEATRPDAVRRVLIGPAAADGFGETRVDDGPDVWTVGVFDARMMAHLAGAEAVRICFGDDAVPVAEMADHRAAATRHALRIECEGRARHVLSRRWKGDPLADEIARRVEERLLRVAAVVAAILGERRLLLRAAADELLRRGSLPGDGLRALIREHAA